MSLFATRGRPVAALWIMVSPLFCRALWRAKRAETNGARHTPKSKRTRQHLPACDHLPPLPCRFVPTLVRNRCDNKGTFVPIAGLFGRGRTNDPLSASPLAATVGSQGSRQARLGRRRSRSAGEGGVRLAGGGPLP